MTPNRVVKCKIIRKFALLEMDNYENYTPDIPYSDEVISQEPGLQQEEPVSSRGRKKAVSGGSAKRRPAKKRAVKDQTASLSESGSVLTGRIKAFMTGQNLKLVLGMLAGAFGCWMLVAFISYLSNCIGDQSLINNSPFGSTPPVANSAGEGGARISEFLINESFGLGSVVIVFWLIGMALKLLVGWPKFKSVNFTIKCLVALITVSLIIGLVTLSVHTPVNWGGYHGRYVNEYIVKFVGWSGAALLSLVMVGVFVLICLRDLINWILRIKRKHDERRRILAEEKAEQERREAELEEMRRREEIDAARAGEGDSLTVNGKETQEATPFSFNVPEGSDSYTLPDIDEYYEQEVGPDSPSDDEPQDERDEEHSSETSDTQDSIETSDAENSECVTDPEPESDETSEDITDKAEPSTSPMVINVNTVATASKLEASKSSSLYRFPSLELLKPGVEKISVDAEEQLENKEKIRKTLLDFDIPIVSIEATVGPTITLYEIRPERGVKISKIRSLVDDIALSLSAIGVRIIAPIPGKGTVGIEVANKDPQTVSMRTVINSQKYQQSRAKLPVAIGSTISNDVYIADLAKMPHLLVAGATGQGKSVGLNAIIASLLYCRRPHELKFVMIDPKQVEFSLYAKIERHYLAKIPDAQDAIITDMNKVVATLNSLCVEMDNRYQKLKQAEVRNLEEYNSKVDRGLCDPSQDHKFLPYIVLVVDEFADLIMTCGKEVEMPIARLAQKARAVGMHVIIATQRPSTNVITGIIKANFPVRIAFKVSSGIDSKTILDTPGAQLLIGRGDMLISNNSEMVRVQCAFIDTPEVEAICNHIASQPGGGGAYILPEPPAQGGDGGGTSGDGDFTVGTDPLFEECARLVVMSNTASTSSLQRRYSIGYNRAGKIMDQLEMAGIVGPSTGGKPRSVLVDPISLEAILEQYIK